MSVVATNPSIQESIGSGRVGSGRFGSLLKSCPVRFPKIQNKTMKT